MDKALAKRAAAVFKWAPGMRLLGEYGDRYPIRLHEYGARPFDTDDAEDTPEDFRWWQEAHQRGDSGPYPGPYLPDLTDPATIGCMWAQVMACLPAPSPKSAFAMNLNEALFLASSYGPVDPKVVPCLIAAMEAHHAE